MSAELIRSLADRIATLTVADATGLAGYLREAYGIEAPAHGFSIGDPGPDPIEPDPISATVDVVLTAAGDKKIQVIRVVRAHTSLGLKEAKDLVDGAPKVVKAGVDRAEAEKLQRELEEQGAKVELR
jgi:large subunit ribosomal protein L7/L12